MIVMMLMVIMDGDDCGEGDVGNDGKMRVLVGDPGRGGGGVAAR